MKSSNLTKKSLIVASLFVMTIFVFSSCTTTLTTAYTRTLEPVHERIMADIDVKGEKVVGTYSGYAGSDMESVKGNAVYNALANGTKGDLLVAPQYEIVKEVSSKGMTSTIKVTVVGYPAFYRNFRPVPKVAGYDFKEFAPQNPFVIMTKDKDGNFLEYKVFGSNGLESDMDAESDIVIRVDKKIESKKMLKKEETKK